MELVTGRGTNKAKKEDKGDKEVVARVSITIDSQTTKVLRIYRGDNITDRCRRFVASNGLVMAIVDTLVHRIREGMEV
eukprot:gnl/Chilomastix_caulleri/2028.p2 GENE.gnl/Chilomastix_caulleri/2028~~gnl/Chilomastix_caulleri/2028.p2  ORF type:complete len:78 (+),score=20.87 gnl/Chilomastix_caulleri/2028:40-273(+)